MRHILGYNYGVMRTHFIINFKWSMPLICLLFLFQPTILPAQSGPFLSFVTLDYLHVSNDSGQTWQQLDVLPQINQSTYLTASARHPANSKQMLLGTSFEGIYESVDGGVTWKFISDGKIFKPLYQGSGFFDEVEALCYLDPTSNDFAFKTAFGGACFRYDSKKKTVTAIPADSKDYQNLPGDFKKVYSPQLSHVSWDPYVPGPIGLSPTAPLPTQPGITQEQINQVKNDPQRAQRRLKAANRRGIYLNASKATSAKNFAKYLELIKSNGMNSIVIDFKDDYGRLTYTTQIESLVETKASIGLIDAPAIIKAAHDAGVYVIARQVVFKDRHLYRQEQNAYAIWDKRRNAPWGVFKTEVTPATNTEPEKKETTQTEFWVDPYSTYVHDYNIAIAKEIESLGVDEIQLDYIRFPSDGNTKDILCRFRTGQAGSPPQTERMSERVQALTTFLSRIRQEISIPLGTDVFGFNSWARMSHLGQDIQAFSFFVDVISPMNYPSHYDRDFFRNMNYFDRAFHIYALGTERALHMTEGRVIMRPYVQAFLLGGERKFTDPQIFDYLNKQIRALVNAGGSGFTLWNNMGNYYMIDPKSFQASFTSQE